MNGFETSIKQKKWEPFGSPAIRYMLEYMDQANDIDLEIIMTRSFNINHKNDDFAPLNNKSFQIDGLKNPIRILAMPCRWAGRFAFYIREIQHAIYLLKRVRNSNPDIVYIDRGNVLQAAILARFTSVPIVLRMLGIPIDLQHALAGTSPFERLLRWAYKSPFSHVICTGDGSGGKTWMEKALLPTVTRDVLLNGVDQINRNREYRKKVSIVLLGRLEEFKGSDFFIESLFYLPQDLLKQTEVKIIGDGTLKHDLETKVTNSQIADQVKFYGAVLGSQVKNELAKADIYVCLNKQGHVSNANLEAISAECCFVVRNIFGEGMHDEEFDELMPVGTYTSIPKNAKPSDLAKCLADLIQSPEKRKEFQTHIAQQVKPRISSWSERIELEINLIRQMAN